MDYFDFDQAAVPPFDLDDLSSVAAETNETDAIDCFDALFFDKSAVLSSGHSTSAPTKLKLINNCEVEVVPHADDSNGEYPMFRAKIPCTLCARMGMDCYLASRGALITGCTACISLYRECSFTHDKMPKGYVSTFPGISEDQQVCHGVVTERKKAMVSMEEGRGRKTGARFPRDAVKILKQWLAEHNDHPYPNEREKDELKQLTGLKRSQIANWLANARRRGKVRPVSGPSSPMLGAIDIPSAPNTGELADLDPMSRWKISPPENEPASMTAIARAITSNPNPVPTRNGSQSSLHNSRASSKKASSEDESNFSMFRAPSVSSFETKDSSNSDFSFASSRSQRSKTSLASSQDRRRRRRAPMTQRSVAPTTKPKAARIFQCTFCTDTFPAKYDWQRHEKSLHLALERWTCCPNGGTKTNALTGQPQCAFCSAMNPSADHLESHNFLACQEKTLQERTFYRKDHLRQHLKLMHNVKFDPSMETWKSTTNEIKSACGFCPSKFSTWQQRADHLAAHFRNGADMINWSGNWGFEPYVERLVENSLPPYLIGQERMTMNPFVARAAVQESPSENADPGLSHGTSTAGSSERCEADQLTRDSNCWHRLEDELIKFVVDQKATGHMPSDTQIQDHARQIIYGDADPWDWTCADNQTWLDAFKFQHGLGPAPPAPEHRATEDVPIMAPYVVKGGLKNKRMEEKWCPGVQEAACPQADPYPGNVPFPALTPGQNNIFDFGPTQALEHGMDLDFDSVDFSALDLDSFGEVNFDDGTGMGLGTDMTSREMEMDTQYVAAQPASMGTYGSFGLQQSHTQKNNTTLSQEDFDQLTGYMAGFH